jgi:hypothetical protein
MSIDINDYKPKLMLTIDLILDNIKEEDIYAYYMGVNEVHINRIMSSPFRKDKNPSFGLYYGKNGRILYNDFAIGGGDIFNFVKLMTGTSGFYNTLVRIANDFKLGDYLPGKDTKVVENNKTLIIEHEKKSIKLAVTIRKWNQEDKKYWDKFNINIIMLKKYRVKPISMLFINGRPVKVNKLAYCYFETKDGQLTHKIYQPYSKYKWFSDNDSSVWQGWSQANISKGGSALIITKSLKDVMAITSSTGIKAISLQNESAIPKEQVIRILKKKFTDVYIMYDNDYDKKINYGQEFAKKLILQHNISNICIPDKFKSKDFSDLIKNKSIEIAKDFLNEIIKRPF